MPNYPPSSYDDNFLLKPPLSLWVAVVYFSRAVMLPILIGVGSAARLNSDATRLLQGLWSAYTLVPSGIAAGVLYALWRRSPDAPGFVRWILAHGRALLAASAGIDLVLQVIPAIHSGGMEMDDESPPLYLLLAGLDVYFLVYVSLARRVRDTFASFTPLPTNDVRQRRL
jgi:hypothetical protein